MKSIKKYVKAESNCRETCLDAAGWLAVLAGRRNPSEVVVEADTVAAAVVAAAYLKTDMLYTICSS